MTDIPELTEEQLERAIPARVRKRLMNGRFFVGGIGPTRKVDVRVHCPNGAVAIREQTTFVDGLFNLITLGIWAPRSSWYYCAAREA